jgi:hypothetical protein
MSVETTVAMTDQITGQITVEPADVGLLRLRIAVVTIGFVIVGAGAGGIFDELQPVLIAAPVIPALVAVWLIRARPLVRWSAAAAAVLITVGLAVAISGGSPSDVAKAFSSGLQGLLSTDWPSPTQPDLIGTMAAILATSCAVGAELAARRRFHLAALLPMLLAALVVVALSAPLGVRWTWIMGLIAVSVVVALLRPDASLHDRMVLLRGERRLIPLLALSLVLVVVAMLPVGLDPRADPRRNDPAEQTAPLLDPIEATLALRALEPARDLHVVAIDGDGDMPLRWRTAALTSYDGRRWSPSLTLRPIGSTLGPATGPTISADVTFLDDNLSLVPLPGSPVSIGAAVETDADRTVVRLAERPSTGDVVAIVANAPSTAAGTELVGVAPRLVDESVSGLTQLAEGLAGDGTQLEQLRQLETTMSEDFVLDSDVQGGGLELALLDRFLRDTQRGTTEQFATSFVLLARSLGIDSRVATGFVAGVGTSDAAPGGGLVLTSLDAEVWPEVQLDNGTWVAYDPVPPDEATDGAPPPPEPQVQSPAAPQPPIAPPPESDNETTTDDDDDTTTTDDALSTALTWALRGALVLSVILFPFVVAAALILGAKHRRKRRRLGASTAADRIRGAWASATDALVDAGLRISTANTDAEIADHGAQLAPVASPELRRLATMSSAATFGAPRHPDLLAQDAVTCLDTVEQVITSERTRWQQLRWRLSLRSLRPATRSPVTD